MTGLDQVPPRKGEGDRAQRGGGGSRFTRRPETYTARKLRREMTLPEGLLWQRLRGKQTGFKFRRQHLIGPYVVDFYCADARLAVEIDGFAHETGDRPARDEMRDRFLAENGHSILRLPASEVLRDVDGAIVAIVARAESPLHQPSAGPPPRAGEELQ